MAITFKTYILRIAPITGRCISQRWMEDFVSDARDDYKFGSAKVRTWYDLRKYLSSRTRESGRTHHFSGLPELREGAFRTWLDYRMMRRAVVNAKMTERDLARLVG